jgi:hypothetical protein
VVAAGPLCDLPTLAGTEGLPVSSVREIVERAAGEGLRRSDQLAALVALVQIEDGSRASAVPEHVDKARQYPRWSLGDLARYGPRIALVTPQVLIAMGQLGIEGLGEAAEDAVGQITEPIIAVAEEPLRWLAWLQDPGTVLRLVKVIGGGLLVLGGAWALARAQLAPVAQKAAAVAGQVLPAGKAATAARAATTTRG